MKSDLQIGVVGAAGYWGPNWVRVLKRMDCLSWMCDNNKEFLDKVAKANDISLESKIKRTIDFEEMLNSDIDAVFVVTPPETHAVLAIKALKAGKHVFIEKPLATTLEDSYRIKFEMEQAKKVVMVGHTFLYHPAIRKFKEHIDIVGKIRSLYTVRANFGQYQQAGILMDLLPHDLSIFKYLCNSECSNLVANVNSYQDVAHVVSMHGGIECSSFLSWSYPDKTRKVVAVGDKGILEWDLDLTHLLFHKKTAIPNGSPRYTHIDEGTIKIMVNDQAEPLAVEAEHFIACVLNGDKPLTDINDGIAIVKGLEACQ